MTFRSLLNSRASIYRTPTTPDSLGDGSGGLPVLVYEKVPTSFDRSTRGRSHDSGPGNQAISNVTMYIEPKYDLRIGDIIKIIKNNTLGTDMWKISFITKPRGRTCECSIEQYVGKQVK